MKIILWLTICFIIFEVLKLLMLEEYWYASLERKKHSVLASIELSYFVYLVALFFIEYWYIGLSILVVSLITAFQVMDDVMEFTEFNKTIKNYLCIDGIVSILLLAIIIIKELIK